MKKGKLSFSICIRLTIGHGTGRYEIAQVTFSFS